MSRAFVTDKEDWIYCAKAGERCMHAESDRPCRKTDCEYFSRDAQTSRTSEAPAKHEKGAKDEKALRVVARKTEKAASGSDGRKDAQPRKTKKASLPKPKKWGGRSGSTTH